MQQSRSITSRSNIVQTRPMRAVILSSPTTTEVDNVSNSLCYDCCPVFALFTECISASICPYGITSAVSTDTFYAVWITVDGAWSSDTD